MNSLGHYLRTVQPGHLFLGLGNGNQPVTINLDSDTPHILLSVPSGGGKSTACTLLAAQILHNGGNVTYIDLKRDTQWIKLEGGHGAQGDPATTTQSAAGNEETPALIPGVTYCKTIDEAFPQLVELGHLMHARYETKDINPDYNPHRILIVAEELNMTADLLGSHWTDLKKDGTSPALKALRSLMYAGRACHMHVLAVTQYGTAQAFGANGAAARENATPILGAGSSEGAWNLTAPQIDPRPDMTNHQGRMHLINGNQYHTVQVGYLTNQQARHWATNGTPSASDEATEAELPGWLQ
jgi:hypothetical protein